jgi:dihydrofolate synthase / folylpolyglutamate synthase
MTLEHYLEDKPLAYAHFDPHRIVRIWKNIAFELPECVRLIGTNGKGTTGRFIAQTLFAHNKKVGHYTSPHIHKINERFWINGEACNDTQLEAHHQALFSLLSPNERSSLSYFEYTTLLALHLFKELDIIVLETGLGGEFDATNIITPFLTLITPIDYDHQLFLGESITEIATTKLNIHSQKVIMGYQKHSEVADIAKEMSLKNHFELLFLEDVYPYDTRVLYLENNRKLAHLALEHLGFSLRLEEIDAPALFGRCTKIAHNITIDVGHNPLAAHALKNHFDHPITLIYNTLADKEYQKILSILKPIIEHLLILEIEDERVVDSDELKIALASLDIPYSDFKEIHADKEYLVFGSFKTVEHFLEIYER